LEVAMNPSTDPAAERRWTCARRLRERRRQLGLTQADVVSRVTPGGVPLTNRTLSAMENGRGIDLGRLPDLAVALDCTLTYLVGLTTDPARWQPDPPCGAAVPAGDRDGRDGGPDHAPPLILGPRSG